MADTRTKSRSNTKTDNLTPAMRQYMEQKAAAPDALLLFRMGDFYETFYEDAQTASRVLGIALTSRGKDKGGASIPLAGIPYHALDSYLTKLVRAGHKVAISEQVEDPKQAKGVVKREIVRIITPGTLTDDALLEQKADNYLACICQHRDQCGLAFVELSTGAFWVQLTSETELLDELVRLAPAELLLAETPIDKQDPLATAVNRLTDQQQALGDMPITYRPGHLFDPHMAQERLRKHFGVATLEGFGFDRMDASLCAAAVIIDYLADTQKTSLEHIVKLSRRYSHDFVLIDQSTWRSLEIERTIRSGSAVGTLLHAVDRTSTAMGGRCLRRWLAAPLRHLDSIKLRQEAIGCLVSDPHNLRNIRSEMGKLSDIERITARLGVGRASPRDLVALGNTLLSVEKIADLLDAMTENIGVASQELAPFLSTRRDALRGRRELAEFLTTSLDPNAPLVLNEGGIIADGYDEELDRLRAIGKDNKQWLVDYQNQQIERTGIPSLKVGYNQVFGYYIEVTNTHSDRVPVDFVRKQTLKNAERYITDQLKKYETEVLTARDNAITREAELFEIIRQHAIEHIPALQELASAVAEIDVVAGLAHLADERRYSRPVIVDQFTLEINEGRHPVLEQMLREKFVPNDCRLGIQSSDTKQQAAKSNKTSADQGDRLVILTGPNMAGKSTYIRQIALLTLLAQTGSYVPATSMRFSPVDRIFTRVGASDEIAQGRSTFMVEMTEAANILNNAGENSLVIIDELGRGTSTFDGLSLAWAIAEQLVTNVGCRTFFATHYHELTELENYLTGVVNYNVAVREWQDEIVFLHRIVRGGTDQSYGVHVAKLAGVTPDVITRSQEILTELENNFSATPRAPRRAARRTKKEDNQLLLFTDPADEIVKEIKQTDPHAITPIDALKTIERWRKQLGQ
ncbi:MAG: DNA mismatch repair protein MutS [Planctomycetota bacterium]|nr:MAG: DNA mismatch repair protein MutS [Planctomycetota bacterium]